VFIGAWLAGPTRPAVALRRYASPYVRDHRGVAYGIAGAVWLALIAWAPIAAFRKPIGILLFAVLFALGTEVLRRQVLREFPDTQAGELSARVREWWARRRKPAPTVAETAATSADDVRLGQLERLAALRDRGVLSEEEFASAKAGVLGGT
jgi:hypothetical protein